MSELPPDRFGFADEQEIEVEEWTDDLGLDHRIDEDDPQHQDSLDERLWREKPDREKAPREEHRLTQPDEGLAPDEEKDEIGEDWGEDSGDLSAEERAVHVAPDDLAPGSGSGSGFGFGGEDEGEGDVGRTAGPSSR
ncbi:DUF5709 domain-containing protein [Nonomuraea rhodomycinica]|uniref:DUF5709 domain-containing protein n=1 Tax=Nonomuraea rhodomycinica TaxID=1712872 RepID=A0A7Y6IR59_9ACTN|nr:DUF5709 domain-containing protein [Nonomuraea rhodomycinica]NUW42892.1 hypothetical protein [Nonomuraea rhodomycinica]